MAELDIRYRDGIHAWVAESEGRRAGILVDHVRSGRHVLSFTEVDPAHKGQGVASRLVEAACEAARANGEQVVPLCPYVSRWIAKHPEQEDLVDVEWAELLAE